MGDIKFTVKVKKSHYKNVAFYNTYVRNKFIPLISIAMIIIGIVGLVFFEPDAIGTLVNIAFIVYPFIMVFMKFNSIKKMIVEKEIPDIQEHTVIFNEDRGITTTFDGEVTTFEWDKISEVREVLDVFAFYTTLHRIIYIPKSDIESSDLTSIRNIVRNKLPFKKYSLKN